MALTSTPGQPLAILDQACGTGVVEVALHDAIRSQSQKCWHLTCTDVSSSMIAAIQERIQGSDWENTNFEGLPGVFAIVGWIDHVNTAAAFSPESLPQISTEDFMRATGDGRWEDPTWVKTQFRNRGLKEVQVTFVGKAIPQRISGFSSLLKGPLNFITSRFWTEKPHQQSGAQFAPALVQHLEDLYGKSNHIEINSPGIIATSRAPH
ncbi:Methyltransferase type 11 [Penicillium fimorum]|uniref:Methyltransferase type 11 n=1 Tax=Penicillium fimorum TaxID=1882269 RepID=A0A9W9XP61_9EURO|nr:Methyltransferase type 11 [Penicillium fimorum]